VLFWGFEFAIPIGAFVMSGDKRMLAAVKPTMAFHSREFARLFGLCGTTGLLFGAARSLFERRVLLQLAIGQREAGLPRSNAVTDVIGVPVPVSHWELPSTR